MGTKIPRSLRDRVMVSESYPSTVTSVAHEQTGEQKKMWKNKNYRRDEPSLQINP